MVDAGNGVALDAELGNPEVVDDVAGTHVQLHLAALRNHEDTGLDARTGVAVAPRELLGVDVHLERVGGDRLVALKHDISVDGHHNEED